MGGFTKLFSRILISSVWSESNETRIVWITLLAMTGPDGTAKITLPGLSRLSVIPLDKVEEAIRILSSPDQYSRTQEHEGRRIKEVRDDSGNLVGFFLYNYAKHRAVDATSAERQRKFRANRDSNARQKNRRTEEQKTTTEERIAPSADSSPPPWSREASDDWTASKGGPPPDLIFRALKTAVTAHGWPTVRPVWQFYLAATAAEFVNVPKFTASFGEWAARANGSPAPGGKQTAGEATMAAVARTLARHEGRRT